jgi:hypothetical protein
VVHIKWQIVAYDWGEVIAEFEGQEAAEAFAEAMDGLALRCYIRPVRDIKRELLERTRAIGG